VEGRGARGGDVAVGLDAAGAERRERPFTKGEIRFLDWLVDGILDELEDEARTRALAATPGDEANGEAA
jgi:hypothetical protein